MDDCCNDFFPEVTNALYLSEPVQIVDPTMHQVHPRILHRNKFLNQNEKKN